MALFLAMFCLLYSITSTIKINPVTTDDSHDTVEAITHYSQINTYVVVEKETGHKNRCQRSIHDVGEKACLGPMWLQACNVNHNGWLEATGSRSVSL